MSVASSVTSGDGAGFCGVRMGGTGGATGGGGAEGAAGAFGGTEGIGCFCGVTMVVTSGSADVGSAGIAAGGADAFLGAGEAGAGIAVGGIGAGDAAGADGQSIGSCEKLLLTACVLAAFVCTALFTASGGASLPGRGTPYKVTMSCESLACFLFLFEQPMLLST